MSRQYAQPFSCEARILTRSTRRGSRPEFLTYVSRPYMAPIAFGDTRVISMRAFMTTPFDRVAVTARSLSRFLARLQPVLPDDRRGGRRGQELHQRPRR